MPDATVLVIGKGEIAIVVNGDGEIGGWLQRNGEKRC